MTLYKIVNFFQIQEVHANGVCGHNQLVLIGDRLISFNGISLKGVAYEICISTIHKPCNQVTLKVLRHHSKYDVTPPNIYLTPTKQVTQNELFAQKNVKLAYMKHSFRDNNNTLVSQKVEPKGIEGVNTHFVGGNNMEKDYSVTRNEFYQSADDITPTTNSGEEPKDDELPLIRYKSENIINKNCVKEEEEDNTIAISSAIEFDAESLQSEGSNSFNKKLDNSSPPSSDISSSSPPPLPTTPAPTNLKSSKLWELEAIADTIDMRSNCNPSQISKISTIALTPDPTPRHTIKPSNYSGMHQSHHTDDIPSNMYSRSDNHTAFSLSSSNGNAINYLNDTLINQNEIDILHKNTIWRPTSVKPQHEDSQTNGKESTPNRVSDDEYADLYSDDNVDQESDESTAFITNIDDVSFDNSDDEIGVNMNYDFSTQNLTTNVMPTSNNNRPMDGNVLNGHGHHDYFSNLTHMNSEIEDNLSLGRIVDCSYNSTTYSQDIEDGDDLIIPTNSREFQHALINPFEALEREYGSESNNAQTNDLVCITGQNETLCMSSPSFPQRNIVFTGDPTNHGVSPCTPPPALLTSPLPCNQSSMGHFTVHDSRNNKNSEILYSGSDDMLLNQQAPNAQYLSEQGERSNQYWDRFIEPSENTFTMESVDSTYLDIEEPFLKEIVRNIKTEPDDTGEETIVFSKRPSTSVVSDLYSKMSSLGWTVNNDRIMPTESVNRTVDNNTFRLDNHVNKDLAHVHASMDDQTLHSIPSQRRISMETKQNNHIISDTQRSDDEDACVTEVAIARVFSDEDRLLSSDRYTDDSFTNHKVTSIVQTDSMVNIKQRGFTVTVADVDTISLDVIDTHSVSDNGNTDSLHSSDYEDIVKDYTCTVEENVELSCDQVNDCDNKLTQYYDNSNVCNDRTIEEVTSCNMINDNVADESINYGKVLLHQVELDSQSTHSNMSSDNENESDIPPLPSDAPPPIPCSYPPFPPDLACVSSLNCGVNNSSVEPPNKMTSISNASSISSGIITSLSTNVSLSPHELIKCENTLKHIQTSAVSLEDKSPENTHGKSSSTNPIEPITVDTEVKTTRTPLSTVLMSPRPFQSPHKSSPISPVPMPVLMSPMKSSAYQTLPTIKPLQVTSFALSKHKSLSSSNLTSNKESNLSLNPSFGGSTHSLYGGSGLGSSISRSMLGNDGSMCVTARVKHRRSTTEPFQIEVLNSRFGLGLTVQADKDNHPVISKIQTSGSVVRNGNIK